jgi:beta-lactamase class A
MNKFHRRGFMAAGLGMLAAGAALPAKAEGSDELFKRIEAELGGRAGLCALDTASGKTLRWRVDERFAMCSSFKWLLATSVLAHAEQGALSLDRQISYSASALIGHSPVTQAHVKEGQLSVDALCAAAVEESDNGAANLLLRQIGGPHGLTRYLRSIGDSTTRLDRNEPSLNENLPGDPRDTTTPDAMVKTMGMVLTGNILKDASRAKLLDWLKNCRTGANRLRRGVPANWVEGDKTGTGSRGAAVDNAIFWPPGRKPILVAAYLSGSNKKPEMLEAALAEMGRSVARQLA